MGVFIDKCRSQNQAIENESVVIQQQPNENKESENHIVALKNENENSSPILNPKEPIEESKNKETSYLCFNGYKK